jgi:nicotinamidase-related amidase
MKRLDDFGVLVVDMQSEFEESMDNKEELIASHKGIFEFAKENNVPIFFLKYVNNGEIIPEINNLTSGYRNKKVIKKYAGDGFIRRYSHKKQQLQKESSLYLSLQKAGVKNLIISGVNRGVCVASTMNGAIDRGYDVFTADDLMNKKGSGKRFFNEYSHYFNSYKDLIEFLKRD